MTKENRPDPCDSAPFYQAHKTKLASACCNCSISKMNVSHERTKRLESQIYFMGFFCYYSPSTFSKYPIMLLPFRRKSKSFKTIFTISAAISFMAIHTGGLLLFLKNSSTRVLHFEQNNSVFLIYFKSSQSIAQRNDSDNHT